MEKKIKVAVLAGGNRARYVVENLLKDSNRQVEIIAIYDPDTEVAKGALEKWESPNATLCDSWQQAVAFPGADWVMIFSPNCFHKEQILGAFAAGKHVFSEKPLATHIEDCQEIYEAHQKSGLLFATGFVLRYSLLYRKAKEILASGKLGKLLVLEGNENITPPHGGYIMCNWRRKTEMAGPHILEKCCHDLDLINWFIGSLPSKVAAFGNRDFFRPENQYLIDKYGKSKFISWWDPHRTETPFTDDTDLMDNMTTIAQFRNGVRVSFTATMSNTIPERRMRFNCTEGTMTLELYKGTLSWATLSAPAITTLDFTCDGHGGGDSYIMKELFETMTTGVAPKCSGNEGLESAVYALALDKAATSGEIFDLEPVWKSMGR